MVLLRSTPVARGPRAYRPVRNRTAAHGARARTAPCGLRLWCGPTRDALLPSSSAEARPHGHCIRSKAAASNYRYYRVTIPWRAARALIAPTKIGRPPTEHASALRNAHRRLRSWCVPTRDAFLPSSLDEDRPHGHRIRSASAASDRRCYRVRLPWRAARALIAPTRNARALCSVDFGCGAGQLATRSSPVR